MPSFGSRSLERLNTCDERLQKLCHKVIEVYDITVLEGYRDEKTQNKAFSEGKSKLKYPDSKHNKNPSLAVDIAPYPIDWNDKQRFYYMAGLVQGFAAAEGIEIRWGGDWDSDKDFKNNTFNDLPHFEVS